MNDPNQKRISEGILILMLTAGAYLFSYYYELGFLSYFDLPASFIRIDLDTILKFGSVIFGILIILFPLTNLVPYLFTNRLHVEFRAFIFVSVLVFFIIIFQAYIFGLGNFAYWDSILYSLLIVLFFLAFFTFVFPLITQRKVKGYMAKIEAQSKFEKEFRQEHGGGIYTSIERRFGLNSLLVIFFLVIGILTSRSIGLAEAVNQKAFPVINSSPDLIVVRIYNDLMICTSIDESSKKISEDFIILKISDNPNLFFHVENIGPVITSQTKTNVFPPSNVQSTPTQKSITPTIKTP